MFWQHSVTLRGPCVCVCVWLFYSCLVCAQGGDLILLLPRDASGHLGVHTLQLTRPTQHILNSTPSGGVCGSVRGITARDVLTAIHNYYAEHMSLGEQLELMYTRENIRRLLQVRDPCRVTHTHTHTHTRTVLSYFCNCAGMLMCPHRHRQ